MAGNVDARLGQAMALHQAGRLKDAEAQYRRILKTAPADARALCMLGALMCQAGRVEAGLPLLERAALIRPDSPEIQFNLAQALANADRTERAISAFMQVLRTGCEDAEVRGELGRLNEARGDLDKAIVHYREAIRLRPADPRWHEAAGIALRRAGKLDDAISSFEAAIGIQPDAGRTRYNYGIALQSAGRLRDAIAQFEAAERLVPGVADVLSNLGNALRQDGRPAEAVAVLERAVVLDSRHGAAQANLANALVDVDRLDDALGRYATALALLPDDPDVRAGFAMALETRGEFAEALAQYGLVLERHPDHPEARFCLALNALARGDFGRGWAEYEWRWSSRVSGMPSREFPQSVWSGDSLDGKRLLIHAEQGLGDEIMFASVFRELVDEAAHCVIECSHKLESLFRRSFPAASIVATDPGRPGWAASSVQALCAPVKADLQVAAGGIMAHRRTSVGSFPAHAGYLLPDPELVSRWRERLDAMGPSLKVGLGWRGGTIRTGAARRSIPLRHLIPLLRRPGVQFISLQYTDCADEIARLASEDGVTVHHWPEALADYDETAALVSALDLTISVCTAVIHLAGALGRPAWVMVPRHPEWRYGLAGNTMPWYPSIRLFRQEAEGDWRPVVDQVGTALHRAVADGRPG